MNDIEFIKEVTDILKKLGFEYETVFDTVNKNGVKREALIIKVDTVSPVLYKHLWETLKDNQKEDVIKQMIADAKKKNETFDVESVLSWETVNKHLRIRASEKRLNDMSVEKYHAFYTPIVQVNDEGSVKVNSELVAKWEVSKQEVWDIALANTNLDTKIFEMSLESIMSGDFEECESLNNISEDVMLIVTNTEKTLGSGWTFEPDYIVSKLRELGAKHNIYILPSSVHECIIIVAANEKDDEEAETTNEDLLEMVKNVNKTEVAPEDRLGDYVLKVTDDNSVVVIK